MQMIYKSCGNVSLWWCACLHSFVTLRHCWRRRLSTELHSLVDNHFMVQDHSVRFCQDRWRRTGRYHLTNLNIGAINGAQLKCVRFDSKPRFFTYELCCICFAVNVKFDTKFWLAIYHNNLLALLLFKIKYFSLIYIPFVFREIDMKNS